MPKDRLGYFNLLKLNRWSSFSKDTLMSSTSTVKQEKKTPYGIRVSLENYAEYENIKVYPLYGINDLVNAAVI